MVKYVYDSKLKLNFNENGDIKTVEELESELTNNFTLIQRKRMKKPPMVAVLGETEDGMIFTCCSEHYDKEEQEIFVIKRDKNHIPDFKRLMKKLGLFKYIEF